MYSYTMEEIDKKTVTTYAALVIVTIIGLFIVKAANISYPIELTTSARSPELAVVGEGKVEVTPDTAYVDAGITVANARSVADAQTALNSANNKIVDAVRKLGIKKENIKTSNYSIFPNTVFESNKNRISGYNGNASLSIKIDDLSLVSRVIEKVTAAGANQVQGARFAVEKPEAFREKAREAAIKNAREQAQKIAKSLGIRLGRIVNIVESTPTDMMPPIYARSMQADAVGGPEAATIEPGTQTISSQVTLYFEKR